MRALSLSTVLALSLLNPLSIALAHGADKPCPPPASDAQSSISNLAKTVDEVSRKRAEQEIIPEILSAEGTFPMEVLNQYDSRRIARSLVARLANTRDKHHHGKSSYYDFRNGTSLKMLVHQRDLESIFAKGFLNSHQITNSSYYYNPGGMTDVESDVINLGLPRYSSATKTDFGEVLPKYAYLSMDAANDQIWKTRIDVHYGDVVVVFKDEVKDRTTFTSGNSWKEGKRAHTLDYKTNDPFPEPNYERQHLGSTWGHQWEAQIWGKLDVSNVSYFMVSCPGNNDVFPKTLELLKASGIPIYKCKTDSYSSRMDRGEKIAN